MEIRKRLYDFLFHEVESERILMNPEVHLLFSKLRPLIPVYRRQMTVSFVSNLLYTVVIAGFLRLNAPRLDPGYHLNHYLLLTAALLLNLHAFLCKIPIIWFYSSRVREDEQPLERLRLAVRVLLLSRVYQWSSWLSGLLCSANAAQIALASGGLLIFGPDRAGALSLALGGLFLVRLCVNARVLQKAAGGAPPAQDPAQRNLQNLRSVYFCSSSQNAYKDCLICFHEFCEDDLLKEVGCEGKHVFHEGCLLEWFKCKSLCPICRRS